jgi:hypothetical protein
MVSVNGKPTLMWKIARDMLLQSIYNSGITFPTTIKQELVSHGITMLVSDGANETKVFMAEPLVLSARLI